MMFLNINPNTYYYLVIIMGATVTIKLPKRDVKALIRVLEDIKFLEKAEKGYQEAKKARFKTLEQLEEKYDNQR